MVTVVLVIFIALGFTQTVSADTEDIPTPTYTSEEDTYTELRNISWWFIIYSEPDFTSEGLGLFSPQAIIVLEEAEGYSGWVLTSSVLGQGWVYTNRDKFFIDRTTGLFDEPDGAGTMLSRIHPQVVNILQRQENWLQICTWMGEKWIELNFQPPVYELDRLLRRFGNNLSVYYRNIETGFTYRYNADRVYFGASISKAMFALYIYILAENGYINIDDTLVFTSADFNAGSGVIKYRNRVGDIFTIRELLRLNLSYSDNIATLMLVRHFGIDGYMQFIEDSGGNPSLVRDRIMNSNLTANEAGLFAARISEYIEADGRYSEEFQAHLLDNQFPFIVSDYPIASKTG